MTPISKRVAYYYDPEVGNYNYGPGHPMKPHRIRMVHNLLVNYGIYRHLQIYKPPRATAEDMMRFHSDDYISFLQRVTPETLAEAGRLSHRFNVGEDCPVFDGLFEYCQISAGGSIAGAIKLNNGQADVAINWAGGLHHAKRGEASGFCYVNDIVLAILELLKYHSRVLYIDIDVHHGDGVEEAFYTTDRVMTVSFHKYGEFFPGTGDIRDRGYGRGKAYAVNVPLRDGIDDESYKSIFEPIVGYVMEWYRPGAVILQCGADSLAGDRLGCFNLSHRGHAACLEFVKKFNLPLMVLGGGGYTIRNVARCWAYETARAVGSNLAEEIPFNDYFEYYGPDYSINVPPNNMANLNSREYLERLRQRVVENLRHVQFAPNVQMTSVPPDMFTADQASDGGDLDQDDLAAGGRHRSEDEFDEFYALENLRISSASHHTLSVPSNYPIGDQRQYEEDEGEGDGEGEVSGARMTMHHRERASGGYGKNNNGSLASKQDPALEEEQLPSEADDEDEPSPFDRPEKDLTAHHENFDMLDPHHSPNITGEIHNDPVPLMKTEDSGK